MKRAAVRIDRLKIRLAGGADPKPLADAVRQALAEVPPERLAGVSATNTRRLERRAGESTAELGRRIVRKGIGGGS
ncbi:hypothetical protein [Nitratireductor sp. XY-223]|uniref:hypothetical protein n=1 Tax=Nitratireductor sp. XY-223 TaxID=2561926 RepID=UPI0010AAD311|nr:hypothetical protein [Nitratireductor sp. XY-223]